MLIALTSVLVAPLPSKRQQLMIPGKAWLLVSRAFFVCLLVSTQAFGDDCHLPPERLQQLQQVFVSRVSDGDTVRLVSGERVRLIGVDTPELDGDEPLAVQARGYLKALIADQPLYLQAGERERDRYRRLLAHLFLPDGRNIEALLLQEGYGFPVAIPPNLAWLDCHAAVAADAQAQGKGVWQLYPVKDSRKLTAADAGFNRVSGVLQEIDGQGGYWWLQMEGLLVLRITREHQPYFDRQQLQQLKGRKIIASGWIVDRSESLRGKGFSPYMLLLTHPLHLQLLD